MSALPNINAAPAKSATPSVNPVNAAQPSNAIKSGNDGPDANNNFATVLHEKMTPPAKATSGGQDASSPTHSASNTASDSPSRSSGTDNTKAASSGDDQAAIGVTALTTLLPPLSELALAAAGLKTEVSSTVTPKSELEIANDGTTAATETQSALAALAALSAASQTVIASPNNLSSEAQITNAASIDFSGASNLGTTANITELASQNQSGNKDNAQSDGKPAKTIDSAFFAATSEAKGDSAVDLDVADATDATHKVSTPFSSALNLANAALSKDSKTLLSDLRNESANPITSNNTNTRAVEQMHAAMPIAASNAASAPTTVGHVATPVGMPGWDNELGQKIVWLANRQDSRAELTLTPPNMGKIEITITMNGDQTNALFVSASQSARDALENALPRLREILADAGITLGQANVNAESAQQGKDAPQDNERGRSTRSDGTNSLQNMPSQTQWVKRGNGLVDTFA